MPLVRYVIRNEHSLANSKIYKNVTKDDSEAMLEGVATSGLIGIIRQLGDLSEFAAEVFQTLHEEVMATASRSHELLIHVQQVLEELPAIEQFLLSKTNQLLLFYSEGAEWHATIPTDWNHFIQGGLPSFVQDSYVQCRSLPQHFLWDKFDVDGAGSCLKSYSDPSFLKMERGGNQFTNTKNDQWKREARGQKKSRGQRSREIKEETFGPSMHPRMQHSSQNVENLADVPFTSSHNSDFGHPLRGSSIACFPNRNVMGNSMQSSSRETIPNIAIQSWNGENTTDAPAPNSESLKICSCSIKSDSLLANFLKASEQIEDLVEKDVLPEQIAAADAIDNNISSDTEQFMDVMDTTDLEVKTVRELKTRMDIDAGFCLESSQGNGYVCWTSLDGEMLQELAFEAERKQGQSYEIGMHLMSVKLPTESSETAQAKEPAPFPVCFSRSERSSSFDENFAFDKSILSPLDEVTVFPALFGNMFSSSIIDDKVVPTFIENTVSHFHEDNNPYPYIHDCNASPSLNTSNVSPSHNLSSIPDLYLGVRKGDHFLRSKHSTYEDDKTLKKYTVETENSEKQAIDTQINLSSIHVATECSETFERKDYALSSNALSKRENLPSLLEENIFGDSLYGNEVSLFTESNAFPSLFECNDFPSIDEDSLTSSYNENGISFFSESNHSSSHKEHNHTSLSENCLVDNGQASETGQIPEMNSQDDTQLEDLATSFHSLPESDIPLVSDNQNGKSASLSSLAWDKEGLATGILTIASTTSVQEKDSIKEPESRVENTLEEFFPYSLLDCIIEPIQSSSQSTVDDGDDMAAMMQLFSSSSSLSALSSAQSLMATATESLTDSESERSLLSNQFLPELSPSSPTLNLSHSSISPVKLVSDFVPISEPNIQNLYSDLLIPSSPKLNAIAKPEELALSISSSLLSAIPKIQEVPLPPNSLMLSVVVRPSEDPLVVISSSLNAMVKPEEFPPPPPPVPPLLPLQLQMKSSSELSTFSSKVLERALVHSSPLPYPKDLQPLSAFPTPLMPPSRFEKVLGGGPPTSLQPTDIGGIDSLIGSSFSQDVSILMEPTCCRKNVSFIEDIAIHNRNSLRKVTLQNSSPSPKPLDARELLLEQIRTQSFSLRHIVVEKHEAPLHFKNINMTAILEKANAVRQAVSGSTEDEDTDDWSDT